MQTTGFLMLQRSKETEELLREPGCFTLLTLIAYRARRTDGFSVHGLKPGEALIGDHGSCGLTQRQYRTAKVKLENWRFATFRATNRGTIAKLCDSRIYDINEEPSDKPSDNQATIKRQAGDKLATTNNKRIKEDFKTEKREHTTRAVFFDVWNGGSGAIKAKPGPEINRLIEAAVSRHGEPDVLAAITNHQAVIDSPLHWPTGRMSLSKFLSDHLPAYLPSADPMFEFLKNKADGCLKKAVIGGGVPGRYCSCGAFLEFSPEPGRCPDCGKILPGKNARSTEPNAFCPKCAKPVRANERNNCPECGTRCKALSFAYRADAGETDSPGELSEEIETLARSMELPENKPAARWDRNSERNTERAMRER